MNYEVVGMYTDPGISGRKFNNRPGLQSLMSEAQNKTIDMVMVFSLSRFGRNTQDTLHHIKLLDACGVGFYSLDLGVDTTTSHGKLILQIMSSLAEFESNQISDRIKSVQSYRKQQGKTYCGNPPFGFQNKNGKLVPVESELVIVKRIKDLHAAGVSMTYIAKTIGIKGKNGGEIKAQTIKKILNNRIYDNYTKTVQ